MFLLHDRSNILPRSEEWSALTRILFQNFRLRDFFERPAHQTFGQGTRTKKFEEVETAGWSQHTKIIFISWWTEDYDEAYNTD